MTSKKSDDVDVNSGGRPVEWLDLERPEDLEFKVINRGTAAAPVFGGIVDVQKPEGVTVESVHVDGATWEPPARERALQPGDVIQLDPERSPWGALLAIVYEVKPWGVICYWLQATERGKAPGVYPYRAETGSFVRVGVAEWVSR